MLLQKIRDEHGRIMVTPVFEEHFLMFKHCSGGRGSFPNKKFKSVLRPVLVAHGFACIRVKELKR